LLDFSWANQANSNALRTQLNDLEDAAYWDREGEKLWRNTELIRRMCVQFVKRNQQVPVFSQRKRAGHLSHNLTMEMAKYFGLTWIFARDIRQGDR